QYLLNTAADVADTDSVMQRIDTGVHGGFGIIDELLDLLLAIAAQNKTSGCIRHHAFVGHPKVNAQEVALPKYMVITGNAVHHLVIHGYADDIRKCRRTAVTQERRLASERLELLLGYARQVLGAHASLGGFLNSFENSRQHPA